MDELQNFLPSALLATALPAGAVMAFFWKGDDAVSSEFKDWLSAKLSGVHAPSLRAGIEPLGHVFDLIFGLEYFSFNSFFRVAAVSTITAGICFIATSLLSVATISFQGLDFKTLIALLIINIIFDYISITKARVIMR